MAVLRVFSRDHRTRLFRLSVALAISLIVHALMVFGVRGTAGGGATLRPVVRSMEVRLVSKAEPVIKEPIADAPATQPHSRDDKPVSVPAPRKLSEPVKPMAEPSAPSISRLEPSVTAGLPLSFDPVFYTWREVDVPAKLQGNGSPPYPGNANAAHISGHVLIEVWVDETGNVDDVKVLDAEPPGYFEEATLSHYKNLRFSPAMKSGQLKRYRTRFMVDFGEPLKTLDVNLEQKTP